MGYPDLFEVGLPILSATITLIIVFLPVLFVTGVAKYLFLPLGLTVSFAMVASCLASMTMIPALCCTFLRPHAHSQTPW